MLILETERLVLERMTPADLDFLAGLLGDPEVMVHFPKPLDRAGAKDWLERVLASYERTGSGFGMVRLRDSGEAIGQVGLIHREINGQPELEVAYMLARRFWGQGFASEAALACRDHALQVMQMPRVVSMIRAENARSLKVAERMGMKRVGQTTHAGLLHELYAYPA
jgi:RimJ/RimL family protein N-acetyltransferase